MRWLHGGIISDSGHVCIMKVNGNMDVSYHAIPISRLSDEDKKMIAFPKKFWEQMQKESKDKI